FWVVPNLVKYHHPFPHVWDLGDHSHNATMQLPAAYRRPLGWALPVDWGPYFELPVITSPLIPRPNFWSTVITGTWTDFYNRGFCRLKGGNTLENVWGGLQGFISDPTGGWGLS